MRVFLDTVFSSFKEEVSEESSTYSLPESLSDSLSDSVSESLSDSFSPSSPDSTSTSISSLASGLSFASDTISIPSSSLSSFSPSPSPSSLTSLPPIVLGTGTGATSFSVPALTFSCTSLFVSLFVGSFTDTLCISSKSTLSPVLDVVVTVSDRLSSVETLDALSSELSSSLPSKFLDNLVFFGKEKLNPLTTGLVEVGGCKSINDLNMPSLLV